MNDSSIKSKWFNYDIDQSMLEEACLSTREEGLYIFDSIMSKKYCDIVIDQIDSFIGDPNAEINYGGSEHRIWHSNKKSSEIQDFCSISNTLMTSFLGTKKEAHNVLAYRNLPIPEDDYALTEGRWHIDSFNNQYKVFLFLKDVEKSNGPLTYIKLK